MQGLKAYSPAKVAYFLRLYALLGHCVISVVIFCETDTTVLE